MPGHVDLRTESPEQSTSQWAAIWPVFLAFGVGRAVPLLVIAVRGAYWLDRDAGMELDGISRFTVRLGLLKTVMLVVMVPIWLVTIF
jgi:hypothetical protein